MMVAVAVAKWCRCCAVMVCLEGKGREDLGMVLLLWWREQGSREAGSGGWALGTGHWGLGTGQATNLIRSSYCTVLYTT